MEALGIIRRTSRSGDHANALLIYKARPALSGLLDEEYKHEAREY